MASVGPREQELRDAAARILALSDPNSASASVQDVAATDGGDAAARENCQLVAPTGDYTVGSDAIGLFQPSFANKLSAGIKVFDDQGITPFITDGYRTQIMQDARKASRRPAGLPIPRPTSQPIRSDLE